MRVWSGDPDSTPPVTTNPNHEKPCFLSLEAPDRRELVVYDRGATPKAFFRYSRRYNDEFVLFCLVSSLRASHRRLLSFLVLTPFLTHESIFSSHGRYIRPTRACGFLKCFCHLFRGELPMNDIFRHTGVQQPAVTVPGFVPVAVVVPVMLVGTCPHCKGTSTVST